MDIDLDALQAEMLAMTEEEVRAAILAITKKVPSAAQQSKPQRQKKVPAAAGSLDMSGITSPHRGSGKLTQSQLIALMKQAGLLDTGKDDDDATDGQASDGQPLPSFAEALDAAVEEGSDLEAFLDRTTTTNEDEGSEGDD